MTGEQRAKKKAYNVAWHAAHPGYSAARNRAWRAANMERNRTQKAAYNAAHKPETRLRSRERYARCSELIKAQNKAYRNRPENRERDRFNKRAKAYGITLETFDVLFKSQNGGCAICAETLRNDRSTHIDHDHNTGVVRGLLCHKCNTAIGLLRDDPTLARAASSYLESHKKKEAA